jgi:hypothetical protein
MPPASNTMLMININFIAATQRAARPESAGK